MDEEALFVDFPKMGQERDWLGLIHKDNGCRLLWQEDQLRQFPMLWIGVLDE